MTKNLEIIISSFVTESLNEILGKFNFSKFKTIAAFSQRPKNKEEEEEFARTKKTHPEIEYAKKFLPEIGSGSSRKVFAMSGGKALKIAMNNAGLEQNKAEVELFKKTNGHELITKVFEAAPDYKWIVSEIVKPISETKFQEITGLSNYFIAHIPRIGNSVSDIRKERDKIQDLLLYTPINKIFDHKQLLKRLEYIDDVLKNPIALSYFEKLVSLKKAVGNFGGGLHWGDIYSNHFGINVDGELKLFDYGLTKDIYKKHYEYIKKIMNR